ncbi:MAG: DUF4190 domain-containing protein [bacterium]|nr:DUF4190 domain-containing protein [bacterium]
MVSSSLQETSVTEREPSFRETEIDDGFVGISKFAVAAAICGLLSSIAIITPSMLWLAIVAVLLGIVALWRIERDPQLGGARFAQAAIVLGAVCGFWSATAEMVRSRHLYSVAAEHAKGYLQVLAAGDTFQALELRKLEPNRQIAGTNLKLVYGGSESESANEMREFLERTSTKVVLESGADSQWEMLRGAGIERTDAQTKVTVRMQDQANRDTTDVFVTLGRVTGVTLDEGQAPTALWYVIEQYLPGDK